MSSDLPVLLQVIVISGLVLCGWLVVFFGSRVPRRADWVCGGALALAFLASIYSLVELVQSGFQPIQVSRAWIWGTDVAGGAEAGLVVDGLGSVISIVVLLISICVLLFRESFILESKPERAYGGVVVAVAGTVLSWQASSPWLCATGVALAVLGGCLCLGSRWDAEAEASQLARFAWRHSVALVVTLLGVALIATGHPSLSWQTVLQPTELTTVGGWAVVAGVLLHFHCFPLTGSFAENTESSVPADPISARLLPAVAAFALLARGEPLLRGLGIFPSLGWIALGASAVSVLSGLLQSGWRPSYYALVSGGFSLAAAVLAQSGVRSGSLVFLGVVFGLASFALAGSALEQSGTSSNSNRKRAIWSKVAAAFGACGTLGMLGFISARDQALWIASLMALEQPAAAAGGIAGLFLLGLLAWKVFWLLVNLRGYSAASWWGVFSAGFFGLMGLAVLWGGTLSGGLIDGAPDRVMVSVADLILGAPVEGPEEGDWLTALSFLASVLGASLALSFWLNMKEDRWQALVRAFPRLSDFVLSGFAMDRFGPALVRFAVGTGRIALHWVDQTIWAKWMPVIFDVPLRKVSSLSSRADTTVSSGVMGALRAPTETAAKVLQLVQNGDVQWYLLFALGFGIAILLHFLRAA